MSPFPTKHLTVGSDDLFLVCSSAISEIVKVKGVSINTVNNTHTLLIALGILPFCLGLFLFFYNLNRVFFWVYLAAFLTIGVKALSEPKKHTNSSTY
jgi:membrane-bound metal-dependent hydrolase YbcI (DUF457 family)